MEELTVPCLSDTPRWYEDIPGLLEVRVQWWKHRVLAGVWGLQEDQVFVQDVLQGQKDLQTLYSSRSCERGMSRVSFRNTRKYQRLLQNSKSPNSCPFPDQHWSQNQRRDQAEHRGAHQSVFRWRPNDCLQPYGERLLPTLPEVWLLSGFNGLHVRIVDDVKIMGTFCL